MKNKLLIIGASGHGKVVADIAIKMNKWKIISFLDDDKDIKTSMGLEVIGKVSDYGKFIDEFEVFVAIGNNEVRQKIIEKLEISGASIPILAHPSAIIGLEVELNLGTVIMAGSIINCASRIGKGCIINTGVTVDHDSQIDDYVHLSPGVNIAGNVFIGKGTWLGIQSTVSNNLKITSGCIIGAGAVVIRDIDEAGTYVGVPVRGVKK